MGDKSKSGGFGFDERLEVLICESPGISSVSVVSLFKRGVKKKTVIDYHFDVLYAF